MTNEQHFLNFKVHIRDVNIEYTFKHIISKLPNDLLRKIKYNALVNCDHIKRKKPLIVSKHLNNSLFKPIDGTFCTNQLYTGTAIIYNPNNTIRYCGNFVNGLYDGFGKLYYLSGVLKYQGAFKEGRFNQGYLGMVMEMGVWRRSSEAILYYPNTNIKFKGSFIKGQCDYGDMYHSNGVIRIRNGDYLNGLLHTVGVIEDTVYNNDGTKLYEGYFYKGYISFGQKYKNDKLIYNGVFKNGKYDGRGELYENGTMVYEGLFKNGLYHGDGILYKNDGILYKNDGVAKKNRICYRGEFKNGKMCGKGKLYKDKQVICEDTYDSEVWREIIKYKKI